MAKKTGLKRQNKHQNQTQIWHYVELSDRVFKIIMINMLRPLIEKVENLQE